MCTHVSDKKWALEFFCREKAMEAIAAAQKDDLILLQDDELVQLFEVTNFKNVHEA